MARRGENIHKRKDGRWEGRYIKARTSEGKIQWGYVYGTAYAEVKQVLIQKKAEAGFYNLKRTDITFSEISEQWLYSVRQGVKESTFSHYQYTLRHYLQSVFGDFKVSTLSEKVLEQGLLAVITPANGKQKPLGATMAQECLSMLRRICKYAAHFHLIRPLEITGKLPQKSPKVLLPFTTEEQKKLRSAVHTLSTRNRLLPYGWFSRSILRATGKRRSSMNFPGWVVRMGMETSVGLVQKSAASFATQRIWAMSATTSPRSTTILKRSASAI